MSKPTEHVGTIERIERVGASHYGNPTYRFTFTDGVSVRTQTDAAVGYEATNYRPGQTVRYTLTRNGRMVGIEHAA